MSSGFQINKENSNGNDHTRTDGSRPPLPTPLVILSVVSVTIFFSKGLAILFLHFLPELPSPLEGFIDAALTILLCLPVIFYLIYKPVAWHVKSSQNAWQALIESEEQHRIISETASDGIITINTEEKITFVNHGIESTFGYTAAEILGQDITMLIPPRLQNVHRFSFKRYLETREKNISWKAVELPGMHKNGHEVPLEISFGEYSKRGMHLFTGVVRNISERKHVMEELRKAKEEAEEATRLKDKFVSLVSHNLRSPFTAILGLLNLLRKDASQVLNEKHKEILRSVLASGDNMVEMIEQLLNISRLQTGKMVVKPIFTDGYFSVLSALGSFRHLANEKGVKLVNEVPRGTRLYTDPVLFNEVLKNLISNGIKFCNRGGRITLSIPDNRKTTIAVKDTGVGIQKQFLSDLFLHEEKTSSIGTAGEKGTGLGLPYSYDIMKAHGGTLEVGFPSDGGSVFYARLPLVIPRILILDHEGNSRTRIKEFLKDSDLEIMEAGSEEELSVILEKICPHLIISDILVSGQNAAEQIKRLKDDPVAGEAPIIALSNDTKIESRERILQSGAFDVISKPVAFEEIIPLVHKIVV